MQGSKRQVAFLVGGPLAVGLAAAAFYWQLGWPASVLHIDYRDAEAVGLGRKVYANQCASCHGANLEGQANWRQRRADGRLPAPPHDESGHTWHHPDQQLFELTKYGTAVFVGDDYQSDMQGYESDLTDSEILAVLAFIKSSWPKEIQERHNGINRRARN